MTSVGISTYLEEKYGSDLLEHPPLITRARLEEKLANRDLVDQHWARISMTWASEVLRRPALDIRSRYLALLGEFTVTKSYRHLEDALRGAIAADVPIRDVLEAILLSQVYSGETVLEPALELFITVARELDVLERLRDDQLPLDGPLRDEVSERATWPAELLGDERCERLTETFGWRGVSTGVHYRGTHHLDSLEFLAHLDVEWGRLWERFAYEGIYSRHVLDDKTRLLCTTADCLALGAGAAASARDHMEEALHFGNSPREMLELVFMTGVFFGFPGVTAARNVLVAILTEQGRLEEVGLAPSIKHKSP